MRKEQHDQMASFIGMILVAIVLIMAGELAMNGCSIEISKIKE